MRMKLRVAQGSVKLNFQSQKSNLSPSDFLFLSFTHSEADTHTFTVSPHCQGSSDMLTQDTTHHHRGLKAARAHRVPIKADLYFLSEPLSLGDGGNTGSRNLTATNQSMSQDRLSGNAYNCLHGKNLALPTHTELPSKYSVSCIQRAICPNPGPLLRGDGHSFCCSCFWLSDSFTSVLSPLCKDSCTSQVPDSSSGKNMQVTTTHLHFQ